jgi:hypothetical protein
MPAVCKLCAHFLQVRIAHVLYREDEDVLEIVRRFLDVGKKLLRQLLALFVGLCEVDYLRAL